MTIGGNVASLSPGETERCGDIIGKTTGVTRSWEYWAIAGGQSGRGAVGVQEARQRLRQSRAGSVKCGGAENFGLSPRAALGLNAAHLRLATIENNYREDIE